MDVPWHAQLPAVPLIRTVIGHGVVVTECVPAAKVLVQVSLLGGYVLVQ